MLDEAPVEVEQEHRAEEGEDEAAGGSDEDPRDDPAERRAADPEANGRVPRHRVRAGKGEAREPAHDEAPDEHDEDEGEESDRDSLLPLTEERGPLGPELLVRQQAGFVQVFELAEVLEALQVGVVLVA